MDAKRRLSSRKFMLVLLVIVMAFLLAFLERLTSEFSMVVSICVPAYIAGNSFVTKVQADA